MNDLSQWRTLANSFPCLARMVSRRELPSDFMAITVIEALGGVLGDNGAICLPFRAARVERARERLCFGRDANLG